MQGSFTGNLGAALCRGLYPHAWGPRPTSAGIAVKNDVAFVTSDCSRCGSSRAEQVNLTTGAVKRAYQHSQAYQLTVEAGADRPARATLRIEAVKLLASSRKTRSIGSARKKARRA